MCKWIQVESSDLIAIAIQNNDLLILFKNNSIYKYLNASNEFNNLLNAASKGKYFNLYIKNNYQFLKVGDK